MKDNEEIMGHCDICGCEMTEEKATSYDNVCVECAGSGAEIIMHFFG